MEPSPQPEPPAQPHHDPGHAGGPSTTDRALAVEEYRARLRSAGRVLDDVDRALSALADGSYGTCAVCAAPIDDAALVADPTTLHCPSHRPPEPIAGTGAGDHAGAGPHG